MYSLVMIATSLSALFLNKICREYRYNDVCFLVLMTELFITGLMYFHKIKAPAALFFFGGCLIMTTYLNLDGMHNMKYHIVDFFNLISMMRGFGHVLFFLVTVGQNYLFTQTV